MHHNDPLSLLETHYDYFMEEMAAVVAHKQSDSTHDFYSSLWDQQEPTRPYN